MPLSKIQLKPGVNKEGTRYSTEGGWNDSDKVRFRKGLPEKIGGWQRVGTSAFLGIARRLHTWRTLASKIYQGIGTHLKLYIEASQVYYDVTPIRKATFTLGNGPLRTVSGSNKVRVTDTTGGYSNGDFVTLAGATGPINNIPASELNAEHQIEYVKAAAAVAQARIDSSSDATLDCDNLVYQRTGESIIEGMEVVGTGITAGTTVSSITSGGGTGDSTVVVEMSAAMTVAEDTKIEFKHTNSYTITTSTSASGGSTAAGGGNSVTATYQINTGTEIEVADSGYGSSEYGEGTYGTGLATQSSIRTWSLANFGEDLIAVPRGGSVYYWDGANNLTTRAVELATRDTVTAKHNADTSGGASTTLVVDTNVGTIQLGMFVTGTGISSPTRVVTVTDQNNLVIFPAAAISNNVDLTFTYDIPTKTNFMLVSDINRFVFCFGTVAYLDDNNVLDPLLLRWSHQDNATLWTPDESNFAGSLRLSRGGEIISAIQARQEILVWTDAALYALQFHGLDGWGAQLVGENISIASPNAAVYANGTSYWMGKDKFYSYDGGVKPLPCSLLRHVFNNINDEQLFQVASGTNEGFNEVWWFYP